MIAFFLGLYILLNCYFCVNTLGVLRLFCILSRYKGIYYFYTKYTSCIWGIYIETAYYVKLFPNESLPLLCQVPLDEPKKVPFYKEHFWIVNIAIMGFFVLKSWFPFQKYFTQTLGVIEVPRDFDSLFYDDFYYNTQKHYICLV